METFVLGWLTVFAVGCLAVMSPGANMAMALKNSLVHSRKAGTYTAAGLALGDAVHVAYCLVGIAVVISQSIVLFNVIKWAGAAYLVYMGFRALLSKRHDSAEMDAGLRSSAESMGIAKAVRSGFLTSLLNPKVTLFFLALFTQVISPETPFLVKVVYGLTVVGIEFGWFALVALFVSLGPVKRLFDRGVHWIERTTGVVLIVLGVRLAFTRANT